MGDDNTCDSSAQPRRESATTHPLGTLRSASQASGIANAAIARELAGWCWSLAVLDG